MGCNLLVNGVYWGYNGITHLLTIYYLPGTSKYVRLPECTNVEHPISMGFLKRWMSRGHCYQTVPRLHCSHGKRVLSMKSWLFSREM